MSESLIKQVLSKLGFLCLEYHEDNGYFSCVGDPPSWSMELFACIRNRFPRILPIDISPFLDNFMVDAVEFWQHHREGILRSGYWSESSSVVSSDRESPHEVNLEALVLTVGQTPLLLLEASQVKFDETLQWLQMARRERLDSLVERKASAAQMSSLMLFDPLTGLSNAQAFYIQFAQWLEQLRRGFIDQFFLIQLDIDRFCDLNLLVGSEQANRCLIQMTQRVKNYLGSQDSLARLGADDLAILTRVPSGVSQQRWIEQLMAQLQSPFLVKSDPIHMTVSMGVVAVTSPEQEVEQSLADVSLALGQAKLRGRGQYCLFKPQWRDRKREVVNREQRLFQAIETRELQARFRPLFSAQNHQVVGVEPCLNAPDWAIENAALQDLTQDAGFSSQLTCCYLESCADVLTPSMTRPLIFLIQTPVQCLVSPSVQKALTILTQQLPSHHQIILKVQENQTRDSLEELPETLAQLQSMKIQLGVSISDLRRWKCQGQIGAVLVDIGKTPVQLLQATGTLEGLDPGPPNLPDCWIIAEQIDTAIAYEQAIAAKSIHLYTGNHLSEPLPLEVLMQLL